VEEDSMTDAKTRKAIEKQPIAYLMVGDLDKPFHRPECECEDCENWRTSVDRQTHKELRDKGVTT
jgi:hypothetical protein